MSRVVRTVECRNRKQIECYRNRTSGSALVIWLRHSSLHYSIVRWSQPLSSLFQTGFHYPILNKPRIDSADETWLGWRKVVYRPISKLSVLSLLLEHLVVLSVSIDYWTTVIRSFGLSIGPLSWDQRFTRSTVDRSTMTSCCKAYRRVLGSMISLWNGSGQILKDQRILFAAVRWYRHPLTWCAMFH